MGGSAGSTADAGSVARALAVAVLLAALGIVAGIALVAAAGIGLRLTGVDITPLLSIVLSLVLATGLGFGGVALLYLRYRDFGLSYVGVRVPSVREFLYAAVGYVAALTLGLSATIVVSQTGVEAGTNNAAQVGMENPEILLLLIPASLLLIGPGEELLYRGVVQNRLRERLPATVAIPLASLIFAAIHYFSLSGAPSARLVSISLLVLPTLVFGVVYELSDNIVVPALTHGAYNATLFSLLYVALQFSGMQPPSGLLFF
nr:type II CAAX endopeptidase family protein [Halogeometricum limi]